MLEETEISTPANEVVEDTSVAVEPVENTDTSTMEPGTSDVTAETETNNAEPVQQETLYAGKYKTVDELVKGYDEAQKYINKASELEKKYNDLLEKQAQEKQQAEQKRLEQAQYMGFQTVEQQEIAQKIQLAEFDYYANNIQNIHPEYTENVRTALIQYYNTGNKAYLEEAKRYYPADFIENVAIAKSNLENKLNTEIQTKLNEQRATQSAQLGEMLKTEFSDFFGDLTVNEGKAKALKSFCDVGCINSKEDMQLFTDIYSQISKYEREQAIKEYEAAKNIDETKNKANIPSGNGGLISSYGLKDSYTAAEIGAMSQEEYNALCDKYGEIEITKRIK